MNADRWTWLGVVMVLVGAGLLVLVARRARRDRRVRRARVEVRKAAYRQGSVWPWAEPMPPFPGRVYRGDPVRDVDGTAVMARVRCGDGRG